jgi:hypothetical protein
MLAARLVTLDAPAGWTTNEHEDGAGTDLAGGDLHITVTLMPAALFEAVLVELPVPTRVEDLREMLGSLLSPLAAATPSEATIVELEGIEVVSVAARGADLSSAVFAFEAVPGVVVIATASGPTGTFDEDAARSVVSSIRVTASPSEVTAAINPPPPPDFPTT